MTDTLNRPKGLDELSHMMIVQYECPCGNAWEETWDSACDDECGACGLTVSAISSEAAPDCDCADCVALSGHDSPVPASGPDQDRNEGSDVDPNKIDLEAARAERIAFASTGDDGKVRHTDLAVYYLHQPPSSGRRWLSEAIGQSTVPGERPRMRRLNVGSLERALKLFEDSDIGVMVSEQARDWAESSATCEEFGLDRSTEAQRPLLVTENKEPVTAIGQAWLDSRAEPQSDPAALAWLYGEVDGTPRATFASMLAKDFDLAPRTVTTALKEGTPIRVPLRSILRFVDRAAFRAWRAANRGKGDA